MPLQETGPVPCLLLQPVPTCMRREATGVRCAALLMTS
jgi:hypothetical protein